MYCNRCNGLKVVYKIGSGYVNNPNSGGVQIKCPLCDGTGILPSKEEKVAFIEKHAKEKEKTKRKKKSQSQSESSSSVA